MAMRNFWVVTEIDGRTTDLTGGPRGRDGGMHVEVRVNDKGSSERACSVSCEVSGENKDVLRVRVFDDIGEEVMDRWFHKK